jgi:hypothetical protein
LCTRQEQNGGSQYLADNNFGPSTSLVLTQTVLGALERGQTVQVASDAVGDGPE